MFLRLDEGRYPFACLSLEVLQGQMTLLLKTFHFLPASRILSTKHKTDCFKDHRKFIHFVSDIHDRPTDDKTSGDTTWIQELQIHGMSPSGKLAT